MKVKKPIKILVMIVIAISGFNFFSWRFQKFQLRQGTTLEGSINNGKLYLKDDYDVESSKLALLKALINISTSAVDSLFDDSVDNISVFVNQGNNSAVSFIEIKSINLNLSDYCYSPFTHEYIHLLLKDYDEFWFQEGSATYLSQYLRYSNSKLQKFCDANNYWFKNGVPINENDLVPISDLLDRYTKQELINLINTREYENLTPSNIVDFYRVSAALCQEIVHKIGIDKFLSIAKSRTYLDRSIRDELSDEGLDIDVLVNEWLSQLYSE